MPEKLKLLSLFSGIGGFEIAAEMAGMETVGQVEIEPFCQKVLEKHWPGVKRMADIKQVRGDEFGTVDIISGGVPCQPASCAGKRRGTDDDRWLWPEAIRLVRTIRPMWCVFENPTGILSLQGGVPFGEILAEMEAEGYEVGAISLTASAVEAPHKRERVFIVAYSNRTGQQAGRCEEQARRREFVGNNEAMADPTNNGGRNTHDRQDGRMGLLKTDQKEYDRNIGRKPDEGTVEPGMGRDFTRLSNGMDGVRWPAGQWPTPRSCEAEGGPINNAEFDGGRWFRKNKQGIKWGIKLKDAVAGAEQLWPTVPGEQYEWEPPRIAVGVKDRVKRLKALGNAVVPAQVYPIFKAIMEIERGGGTDGH